MLQCALDAGGMEAALGLARAFGGQDIYIPKLPERHGDNHPLVVACGRKAAEAIMRQFGGKPFEVPTMRSLRRPLALAMLAQGLPHNQIAKATGLSSRDVRRMSEYLKMGIAPGNMPAVRRIRAKPVDPRQIDIEHFLKRR